MTNPTLLQLLELGAAVEFANGTKLVGDDTTRDIVVYFNGANHGSWNMNKEGLKNALADCEEIFAEHMGDDFSDIAKPGYGILIETKADLMQQGNDSQRDQKKYKAFNIVNEGGEWLEGADTRAAIRARYLKRLAKA